MKKILILTVILTAAFALASSAAYGEDTFEFKTFFDGGNLYVPVRQACEFFGAEVSYDELTTFVTIVSGERSTVFKPGDSCFFLNKSKTVLPYATISSDGVTLVPLGLVSAAVGEEMYYDEESGRVKKGRAQTEQAADSLEILKVTAKGSDGNLPENTLDGNYGTRWSMEGVGCWIEYELKEETEPGYVGIAFYNGNERITKFTISVSADGESYTQVYDGESEATLNMIPFDISGQSAKFVRITCSGNSINAWNSLTEVKIFPKRADGEMPLNEPNQEETGGTENIEDVLNEEQIDMYNKVSETMKDALKWVAGMYEPETGGFCYSQSAKDNPDIFGADLESTRQAVGYLQTYGLLQYMPEDLRSNVVRYIQIRQNPETGYFVNPYHTKTTNARQLSRDMGCVATLKMLGSDPLYKTPGELLAGQLSAEQTGTEEDSGGTENTSYTSNMPAYMASPEVYGQWIDSLSWDSHSWTAGDTFMNSSTYIAQLPAEAAGEYWQTAMNWLIENQNPDTGDWGTCEFGINISGVYKVITFLRKVPSEYLIDPVKWYPNADALFANILENFPIYTHSSMLMTRNITDILIYLRGQIPESELMEHMPDLIRYSYEDLLEYRFPDGSFSEKAGYSPASTGAGYNQALGVSEGCMNVALSAEAVLKMFNAFYGVKTPKFTEEFAVELWQIMYSQSI